jgi:hypothetical protein
MNGRLSFRLVLFGLYGDELPAPRQRDGILILKPGGAGQSEPSNEQEQQNFLL